MRAPLSTHPLSQSRHIPRNSTGSMSVEGVVKQQPSPSNSKNSNNASSSKPLFPEHTRGALFTARVSKQTTTNTPSPPPPSDSTFQPVPNPEIDDDEEPDFPLEELEEASKFNQQQQHELSYHDTREDGVEAYISDSDDQDDDDEVSHISQTIHSEAQEDPYSGFQGRKASPALSDSGASSAFSPTNKGNSPFQQRTHPPVEPVPSPSSRIIQMAAEQAGITQKPPRQRSFSASTPVVSTTAKPPPRPMSSQPPTPTHTPKTRISIQTTTRQAPVTQIIRPIAIHGGTSTPVVSNLGVSEPKHSSINTNMMTVSFEEASKDGDPSPPPKIVSNPSDIPVASSALNFPSQTQSQPQPTQKTAFTDTTPLVANGRKAIVTPNASPDRAPDEVPEANNHNITSLESDNTYETSSDWSKSAVDQMTNAVGTLARLGQSFLKGPAPPAWENTSAQQQQQHRQPRQPDSPVTDVPPLTQQNLQQQRELMQQQQQQAQDVVPQQPPQNGQTMPQLLGQQTHQQFMESGVQQSMYNSNNGLQPPMMPQNASTRMSQGSHFSGSAMLEAPSPHATMGSTPPPAMGQPSPQQQQQQQQQQPSPSQTSGQPMPPVPYQPTNLAPEDTRNDLSNALDKMNLDDPSSSVMSSDQQSYVNGYETQQQQYQQLSALQPNLHPQLQSYAPSTVGAGSAYGAGYSQTGTEHVSNQKHVSASLAAALIPSVAAAVVTPSKAPSCASGGENTEVANATESSSSPQKFNLKEQSGKPSATGGGGADLTPMMRMRHPENDHQSVVSNGMLSQSLQSEDVFSYSVQSQSIQSQMTEEEFHAMKQRKWKEKKKIADRTRAREREKLEGGKKKREDRNKRKRIGSNDGLDIANFGACQSGIQLVINNIIDGSACGRMDDEEEDSEVDEDSTIDGSTTASEDETETQGSSIQSSVKSSIRSSVKSFVRSKHKSSRGRPIPDSPSRASTKLSSKITEEESYMANATTDGSRTETTGGFSSKVNMEKFKDKNFIKTFMSEISTDGIKVLHHKEAGKNSLSQPQRVLARLLLGKQNEIGEFSEPRLEIRAEDDSLVVGFAIFDVRTLEKASVMKLKAYPLSLPGNSILIRLSDGDYVFEAPNEDAAARFVHGMRWLIARLSFNLIIGNASVSCELLALDNPTPEDMQPERAMNNVSNHLADKTTQFVTL